jgi:hypothetical protein
MRMEAALAVSGRHREGRCVGPYHYRDPDIAERVVRLLVMSGYDVTVEECEPAADDLVTAFSGDRT